MCNCSWALPFIVHFLNIILISFSTFSFSCCGFLGFVFLFICCCISFCCSCYFVLLCFCYCCKLCILFHSYCLCCFIDEVVLNTSWGGNSSWASESLLSSYHNETSGGQYFYTLLDQALNANIDQHQLIELIVFFYNIF